MTVRVRFAPSPTGHPHIGNIRTVVFNWLFARQNQGQFVLRIEDTDRTRYVDDAIQVITDGLRWLGMDWDEGPEVGGDYGPYIQSERVALYQQKAEELIEKGLAYRCNCSPERIEQVREAQRARGESPMYDEHCRNKPEGEVSDDEPHVIRLKVPHEGTTTMHDILRGDIIFENRLLDDQILLKSDGFPTYHLAVVVDDHLMGITHILRGDDWISSTPKRLLMYEAFGWEPPIYAHVPLVLGDRWQETRQTPRRCLHRRIPAARATCPKRSSTSWRCSGGHPAPARNRRFSRARNSSSASTSRTSTLRPPSSPTTSSTG